MPGGQVARASGQIWDESMAAGPRRDSQGSDAGTGGLVDLNVLCTGRNEGGLGSRMQLAHRSRQLQEGTEQESEAVAS